MVGEGGDFPAVSNSFVEGTFIRFAVTRIEIMKTDSLQPCGVVPHATICIPAAMMTSHRKPWMNMSWPGR